MDYIVREWGRLAAGKKLRSVMGTRYVGNLNEKGEPNSNFGSFIVEGTLTGNDAIHRLWHLALEQMEADGIATAVLTITTGDGVGVASVELENRKHHLRE
jgi:hypothetical protein